MNVTAEDFQEKLDELERIGEDYADAKSTAWFLQEMKKSILARLTKASPAGKVAEKELDALTDQQYLTHLEGTKEAIRQELCKKGKWEKTRLAIESLRSLSSQYTAQIKFQQ